MAWNRAPHTALSGTERLAYRKSCRSERWTPLDLDLVFLAELAVLQCSWPGGFRYSRIRLHGLHCTGSYGIDASSHPPGRRNFGVNSRYECSGAVNCVLSHEDVLHVPPSRRVGEVLAGGYGFHCPASVSGGRTNSRYRFGEPLAATE